MEGNKNTALLTVIAIATLLVAVIGATFAYFTAQGDTYKERGAVVKTESTDYTSFTIDKNLSIDADQYNFSSTENDLSDTAIATALFESSTTTNPDRIGDKCYTLKLEVISNDFTYTHENAGDPDVAELTLTVTKVTSNNNDRSTATSSFVWSSPATTLINAMDITTLAAGNYYIPVAAASSVNDLTATPQTSCDGSTLTNVHKLTADPAKKSADKFTVTVTLVNKEYDQQEITEKTFTGKLRFDALDSCLAVNNAAACTSQEP